MRCCDGAAFFMLCGICPFWKGSSEGRVGRRVCVCVCRCLERVLEVMLEIWMTGGFFATLCVYVRVCVGG